MKLSRSTSTWLQLFVAGFSVYGACSLALAAIYFARIEDGLGAPGTPPLMFCGFFGFVLALVSLIALAYLGVRRIVGLILPARAGA